MERLICIVGATATGKTRLSVALAKACGAEIVSYDSMQVYREMDVGTAKPTAAEMGGVPHHMLSIADPREPFSVSRYVELADVRVQDILSRGKQVVLVGGTGLYLDSLLAGRQFAPYPQTGVREELTALAEEKGIGVLVERLRAVDPEAAQTIPAGNQKRIIRALEVYLETGRTITAHNRESQRQPPKYAALRIGLDFSDRAVHAQQIARRVEEMFSAGLEREVRALLDSGVSETATSMQAIGYKELLGVLRGEAGLDAAREEIKLRTRQYAKRQRTWFRRAADTLWLPAENSPEENIRIIQNLPDFDK